MENENTQPQVKYIAFLKKERKTYIKVEKVLENKNTQPQVKYIVFFKRKKYIKV